MKKRTHGRAPIAALIRSNTGGVRNGTLFLALAALLYSGLFVPPALGEVIFDIGGNKFRLVVHVAYRFKRVLIKFVGTHKEYDSIDPTRI